MIEIATDVTHWCCSRMNLQTGTYEKLRWGPPGKPQVSTWKIPEATAAMRSGARLVKRVQNRWGFGIYRVYWLKPHPETGKRNGAGNLEFTLEKPKGEEPPPPAVVPAAPPYGYPFPPAAAQPPTAGYPYGYPPPGFFPGGPGAFPPLDGFQALSTYADRIRQQERQEAKEGAERYRADIEAQVARERLLSEERMQMHAAASTERIEAARREHELSLKRIEADLKATRAALDSRAEEDPNEAVLEKIEELQGQIEEAKGAATTAGQQAMGILQTVIEKVGGPVGEALSGAIKTASANGARTVS